MDPPRADEFPGWNRQRRTCGRIEYWVWDGGEFCEILLISAHFGSSEQGWEWGRGRNGGEKSGLGEVIYGFWGPVSGLFGWSGA